MKITSKHIDDRIQKSSIESDRSSIRNLLEIMQLLNERLDSIESKLDDRIRGRENYLP